MDFLFGDPGPSLGYSLKVPILGAIYFSFWIFFGSKKEEALLVVGEAFFCVFGFGFGSALPFSLSFFLTSLSLFLFLFFDGYEGCWCGGGG